MSDLNTSVPKSDRDPMTDAGRRAPYDPKQRKMMLGSLCLLLLALGIVLWVNRDFWFPGGQEDAQEVESDQPLESSPATKAGSAQPSAAAKAATKAKAKRHIPINQALANQGASAAKTPAPQTAPAPAVTTTRTILPPVEMEVVAGDTHRRVRPGSSSVRVDLQPGAPPQPVVDAGTVGNSETAAKVTRNATERVEITTNASEIVTAPVRPNYPLLARQMKVEGSVILQALIGKDGVIQNLRLVSGPHILASAAEDAVRQWKFKPHFVGGEAVETQAKITVNFTISTN